MLNNLFGIGAGKDIHIIVSPSCGVEMMELDKTGNIKSYAQTELAYNEALREINNYEEFKNALDYLFKARNISPVKANIHLSLPTVWFAEKDGLPLLLDDSAITNVVLGELEQTYIFKRKEPMPFWFDALASSNSDSRNVFYTAVQKEAIDQIKAIFEGLGANLVSVDCSLFADLRALAQTGIAAEQMMQDQSWSLMIINNSGFQLLGMQGKKILEYYEEPLPIKSYEGEEIYSAIENAAQIALMSTPSTSLIVISESDLVSAEILAGRLQFGGNILFVEDNQFKKEPLTQMSLNILQEDQIKVSLHAIGSIIPPGIIPVNANFIAEGGKAVEDAVIEIPLGDGKTYELTKKKATTLALIILACVLIPVIGFTKLSEKLAADTQAKSAELDQKISELDNQIKSYEKESGSSTFIALDEIEKVLQFNRTKIMAYTALGESIPKNLYLTYFMTGADGMINIKGCADSVEDVYVFFKNLKDSLIESKLRISRLDLKNSQSSLDAVLNGTTSSLDNAPYIFEITNMDETQLKSFVDKLTGKEPEKPKDNPDENKDNNNNDKKNNNNKNLNKNNTQDQETNE